LTVSICVWVFSISASVTQVELFHQTPVNTSKTGWTHDLMVAMDTAGACDVSDWQSCDTMSVPIVTVMWWW